MGIYSRLVLPQIMEWVMSNPVFSQYRQQVLEEVSGKILEIGFGTGLNLAYYPANIQEITIIDSNLGMKKFAQKRIEESKLSINSMVLNGEKLPLENESFDTVVSTWTLCSINQVEKALAEIYRVLKIGGKFHFIEHGLSKKPQIQIWQNRLTPFQKIIADGCHLNRNIKQLVEKQFRDVTIKEFNLPNLPEISAYMYQGIAKKS